MSPLPCVMVPAHLARDEDRLAARAMGRVTQELVEHSNVFELPHMVARHGTMWRVLRDHTYESLDEGADGWVRTGRLGKGVGHRPLQGSRAKKAMVGRYLEELVVAGLAERRHGWARAMLPKCTPLEPDTFSHFCEKKDGPISIADAKFTIETANRLSPPCAKATGQAVRGRTDRQKARDTRLQRNSRGRFIKGSGQRPAGERVSDAGGQREATEVAATNGALSPVRRSLGQIVAWDGDRPVASTHPVSGARIVWAHADEPVGEADVSAINAEFGTSLTCAELAKSRVTYDQLFCAACAAQEFPRPDIVLTEHILAVLSNFASPQVEHEDTHDPQGKGPQAAEHPSGQRPDAPGEDVAPRHATQRDRPGLAS